MCPGPSPQWQSVNAVILANFMNACLIAKISIRKYFVLFFYAPWSQRSPVYPSPQWQSVNAVILANFMNACLTAKISILINILFFTYLGLRGPVYPSPQWQSVNAVILANCMTACLISICKYLVFCVPCSQRSPVYPSPQWQSPVTTSSTPPYLQSLTREQSGPYVPDAHSEWLIGGNKDYR